MTVADIANLRAQACELVAVLGEALDSLQTIDEIARNPSPDAGTEATAIALSLNQAASAAELLAGCAEEFAQALERHYGALCPSSATDNPVVAWTGEESQ